MSGLRAHLLSDLRLRRVVSVAASVGVAAVMLTACKPPLSSAFPGQHSQPSATRTPTATAAPTTSAAPTTTTTTPTTTTSPTTTTTTTSPVTSSPTTTTTTTTTTKAPPAGPTCTSPTWKSADPDGMWNSNGYIVHNNMWNVSGYKVSQTIEACSYRSWNVTATADNSSGDGAVKTYPNVHKDYHNWSTGAEPKLSSFKTLQSTFAGTGPDVGIYDIAYDIWLNGVPGKNEVMIWTDNHGQTPWKERVATGIVLNGITWDLWSADGNSYLAFVPREKLPAGSLDLLAMLNYLVKQGRVPATSTLGAVDFGVEVVSTNGAPATFRFTDFSVTDS